MIGRRTFRSLRNANYRIWAAGAIVSNIGTWVQRTAQSWLVLAELTHGDASALGVVLALQFAPQLLFLPVTGYVADHVNQRRLLTCLQAMLGLLALGLGLLTVTGVVKLWQVDVFAFLFGTVAAFDAPVRQTFVAELVGDADLSNAVALNSTSFNAARFVGPAVAGLVIAHLGTGWGFVANGVSFFAVVLSLLLLRTSELRPNTRASRRGGGGLTAGARYVWARPDLRALLFMLGLIGTFGLNFQLFISTMAIHVYGLGAQGFANLSSAMAIGSRSGAFVGASREKPRFELLFGGSLFFGLGCMAAAVSPTPWVFAAALIVAGAAALTVTNTSNSLMQLSTEPAMRGRVMAIRVAVVLGGTPIGAPIVGFVADHLGPRPALGIGAASGFAAAVIGRLALRRAAERSSHRT